jgi:hypothetical protein
MVRAVAVIVAALAIVNSASRSAPIRYRKMDTLNPRSKELCGAVSRSCWRDSKKEGREKV